MKDTLKVLAIFMGINGRISRSHYWLAHLTLWLIVANAFIIASPVLVIATVAPPSVADAIGAIGGVWALAVIAVAGISSLHINAMRLHDFGRSGWWQLAANFIVPLWLYVWLKRGSNGPNCYGIQQIDLKSRMLSALKVNLIIFSFLSFIGLLYISSVVGR